MQQKYNFHCKSGVKMSSYYTNSFEIIDVNQINKPAKITNNNLVILAILFKMLLDYAYILLFQTYFSLDVNTGSINSEKLIISYLVTLVQFYAVPKIDNSPRICIVILLFYIMVPISTVYALKNENTFFYLLISFLFICYENFSYNIKIKNSVDFSFSSLIILIFFVITIIVYVKMFLLRGLPTLDAFNLANIYEIREENALIANKYLYYFVRYQTFIINPISIVLCYLKNKKVGLVFFIFLQVLLFLWLGHKSAFFLVFALIIILFLSKHKNMSEAIGTLFLLFTFLLLLFVSINPNNSFINMVLSLYVRRALFVPAVLKFNYFEYFLDNPTIGFWGTIVAPLLTAAGFTNPYPTIPVAKEIGYIYTGGSYANTGLWAAEIAHFGIIGVFVTFLCLVTFDYLMKLSDIKNGKKFTIVVLFSTIIGFNNGSILDMFSISSTALSLLFLFFFTYNKQ